MKRILFMILPILVIATGILIVPRLMAGGTSPITLILISGVLMFIMIMSRPKKAVTKSMEQISDELLDDYCANAFDAHDALGKKYEAVLRDIGNNMPKAASAKLKKLESECVTDPQKYAVALAAGKTSYLTKDFKNVIRQYNKAIVLNPTPFLAYSIGDCHQRLGALEKARDSYEFACELDPSNPKYPSSLATAYVGDGMYDDGIAYALDALNLDENYAQALATLAICYGVKDNRMMYDHYRNQAVDNGYSQEKIESTVKALKKRDAN